MGGDFPIPWYAFVVVFVLLYLLATVHILREYGLGKTIDQAFADAAPRIASKSYDLVNLAFHVGKQRGGNLAQVFEKIAASIREIWRLEEHLRTVSTEGRSSARFMTAMPPVRFGASMPIMAAITWSGSVDLAFSTAFTHMLKPM